MRYDFVFIGVAVICLLGGEVLGIWMGANNNFALAPVHAHTNLIGWVTLSLYGLAHRAYPALGASRLAMPQAVLAIAGAVVMPFALAMALTANNILPAIIDSFVVLSGTLLFAVLFFRHAGKTAA
jgi:hypothetical protein